MSILGKLVALVSRRSLRAEGHVFAITPERAAVAEGVRAALAMAPLLAAAAWWNRPELVFGAVAVFWNCLCDPQGSRRARLKTMVSFTALGAIVMPLAAWIAHGGYAISLVALFALVFLCGLTRSYKPALGPMPAQAGLVAQLAVVIGIASARPFDGALALAGYFLLGAIWAIVFCVFLWPTTLRRTVSLTRATVFGRLDDMAAFLESLDSRPGSEAEGWAQFDTVYRRGVRMSIERGRALAAHDACSGSSLGASIDAAGRVFSSLVALGHFRRETRTPLNENARGLLRELRVLLQALVAHAEQGRAVPAELFAQAETLKRVAGGRSDQASRAVGFAAKAIGRLGIIRAAQKAAPEQSSSSAPVTFKIDALVWRHALRVSVAAVVAYAVGTWLNVTFAYWSAIAAIIVTQPISANTWLRILERACGSLIGGSIAAVLLMQLSSPAAMAVAILPLAALAIASRLVNYGLFVVFLTPMFMLASDFIHPAHGLILARFINELVGAGLGVAASFLLWPDRTSNALTAAISAAISANMKFAAAVRRLAQDEEVELDRLQREAGMASSRLETTRERMQLEGRWRSARLGRVQDLIVALRSVCGAAAVVEVLREGEPDAHDRQRADHYDALAAALLDGLAGATTIPPAQPSEASADDLDQAIRNFMVAFDVYAAMATDAQRPRPA